MLSLPPLFYGLKEIGLILVLNSCRKFTSTLPINISLIFSLDCCDRISIGLMPLVLLYLRKHKKHNLLFCPLTVPMFIYATISTVNMLVFRGREASETLLFATGGGILSFDLDWYRDWLYWTNQTGHMQRTSLSQVKTEVIPTPLPG